MLSDAFCRMPPSPSPARSESWFKLPDGSTFVLKGSCAIGRQPENDLSLDQPTLSRRHALLTAEAEGYSLSDLHSRNDTFVNGSAITRPVILRDGDEIRFGDVIVHFYSPRPVRPPSDDADIGATRRLDLIRERPCWLLLVDVAGFAALNEKLGSEAAHHRMQAWTTALRPMIERNRGHINGYLGDAIFAYWLADTEAPDTLLAALRAIEAWRPASPLAFRVVAHHGRVLFTHSDRGEELTGHEVNFLFRSEKIAKTFQCSAMLSEAAARSLGLMGHCPALGSSTIEGMTGNFSFFGLPADYTPARR